MKNEYYFWDEVRKDWKYAPKIHSSQNAKKIKKPFIFINFHQFPIILHPKLKISKSSFRWRCRWSFFNFATMFHYFHLPVYLLLNLLPNLLLFTQFVWQTLSSHLFWLFFLYFAHWRYMSWFLQFVVCSFKLYLVCWKFYYSISVY